MYIRNHPIAGCTDPVYLVRCESPADEAKLFNLADAADIGPHDRSRISASGQDLNEAVDKFIFRVLMGHCTPEETAILPVVLDQLWAARPGSGERDKEGS